MEFVTAIVSPFNARHFIWKISLPVVTPSEMLKGVLEKRN